MQILSPELIALDRLRPNPNNPREAIGASYLAGLRASIERYGFSGVLSVGENTDGTFTVLDGNTRLDELKRAGVRETWCNRVPACKEGVGDWVSERTQWVLAFDRMRKKFSETAVLEQLKDLAAKGEDLKRLAVLSGKANLERLLAEAAGKTNGTGDAAKLRVVTQASLVLYGPQADVLAIGVLLKQVKGKLSTLEKAHKALAQANDFLDWDDPKLLTLLLATIARFGDAGNA